MAGYILVELTITDHEGFKEYIQKAPLSIKAYDGSYVLRGRLTENLEGMWSDQILVILEFPSIQRAKEWWSSKEYAQAKEIRRSTAITKMSLFESF